MPRIGDVKIDPDGQPSIVIHTSCGKNAEHHDRGAFRAPKGWVIYEVRIHEITDNGHTIKHLDGNALLNSLPYEEFVHALEETAGAFLEDIKNDLEFMFTYSLIQKAVERGWFDYFSPWLGCNTDLFHTAEIERHYYISIVYIGYDVETLRNEIADWLSYRPMHTKVFKWSEHPDRVVSDAEFGLISKGNRRLFAHQPPNGVFGMDSPSVYFYADPFPPDTNVHFRIAVRSEGGPRDVHLTIWKIISSGMFEIVETTERTPEPLPSGPHRYFEISGRLAESMPTHYSLYWHDDSLENVIVHLDETTVTFTKSFR